MGIVNNGPGTGCHTKNTPDSKEREPLPPFPKSVYGDTPVQWHFNNDKFHPFVRIAYINKRWVFSENKGMKCFFIGQDRYELVIKIEAFVSGQTTTPPMISGIKMMGTSQNGNALHCARI
jgi:hypothetical protein